MNVTILLMDRSNISFSINQSNWNPIFWCAPMICNDNTGLHTRWPCVNSLAPGRFEWNFRHVIFKQILVIDDWGISCEIALTWKPHDLTDDKSTLVQVMAWCRQATSHYLSQCWPSSLSPYGVTRPQWVNSLDPGIYGSNFISIFYKLITQNSSFGTHMEIDFRWMPQNLTNKKSTSFQVLAWCREAASHYLSIFWPRSMLPYGTIRPQWVDPSCAGKSIFSSNRIDMMLGDILGPCTIKSLI